MSTLTRPAPPFVQRPSSPSLRMHAWIKRFNRPVFAVLAVGLIAGYLRFVHLAYPEHRVFDEYYYTKSACILLGYSDQRCDINSADERFWREKLESRSLAGLTLRLNDTDVSVAGVIAESFPRGTRVTRPLWILPASEYSCCR
jgi:hypothetical protein